MGVIRAFNRWLRALLTGQIFNSADPLTSRERFASRRYLNQARLGTGFIVFALIWSPLWLLLLPVSLGVSLLALALGYAAAFGLVRYYHIVWEKRPLRLRCPNCRKVVVTNTPWVCGYCRQPNLNPLEIPFVDKCANPACGIEPKTYRCHHCNEFIYLTPDRDEINYAYRFNSPKDTTEADIEAKKQKEEREKGRYAHSQRVLSKNDELDLAKLEEELAIIRMRIKKTKTVGKPNSKEAKLEEDYNEATESADLVRRLKEKISVEFKGNASEIRRRHALVDMIAAEHWRKEQ
jgi:hypothetical protein